MGGPAAEGYPRLAHLMGKYPGEAIFRRFATLNARNLLYLQAELVQLEWELEQDTNADCASEDGARRAFQTHARTLREEGKGSVQWEKVLLIREKLKEYSGSPVVAADARRC